MRTALVAAALLLGACSSPPSVTNHDPASPEIKGLIRLSSAEGAFVPGAEERFRAVLDDAVDPVSFAWTASAGELRPEGDTAVWVVPDQRDASLRLTVKDASGRDLSSRFDFRVDPAVKEANAPLGPVDTTRTQSGSVCDLAFNGANPVVAYRDDQHNGLWLGTWNGTAWVNEFVDGPGFNVGGLVGSYLALTLDGSGTPHLAYLVDDKLRYATRSGTTWIRETVDSPMVAGDVGIALDAGNGNRPTVVATRAGSDNRVVVAWRTGANTWAKDAAPFAVGNTWEQNLRSGMVYSGGLFYFAFSYYQSNELISVASFQPGGAVRAFSPGVVRASGSAVAINAGKPYRLAPEGLYQYSGLTLGTATSSLSRVETYNVYQFDLAWSSRPEMVQVHDGLEFVTTNAEGYWVYRAAGKADTGRIAVAVDSGGVPHACYRLNNVITYQ